MNSQSYCFSSSHVQMWELDNQKDWCQRIDAFELWCRRRLESPLDGKEIKLVHPKGNLPWIFTGRLMLKQKLQYFGHLMWRADSLEKTLMLGKIEGKRRRGWQRRRWLNSITDSWIWANSETVKDTEAWHAAVHGDTKSWTQPSDWTATTGPDLRFYKSGSRLTLIETLQDNHCIPILQIGRIR